MKITLDKIAKKFNSDWVFKNISHQFSLGEPTVILGANGSGKSTLCQVIAGYISPTKGNLIYQSDSGTINTDEIFKYISVCSPHTELFEELTFTEMIKFYNKFKPFVNNYSIEDIVEISGLKVSENKQIIDFSSGMKQRVKLVLTLCADVPVLLLDEPCSNLDNNGIDWYKSLVNTRTNNSLLIIASNQKQYEYSFCNNSIELNNL